MPNDLTQFVFFRLPLLGAPRPSPPMRDMATVYPPRDNTDELQSLKIFTEVYQ